MKHDVYSHYSLPDKCRTLKPVFLHECFNLPDGLVADDFAAVNILVMRSVSTVVRYCCCERMQRSHCSKLPRVNYQTVSFDI